MGRKCENKATPSSKSEGPPKRRDQRAERVRPSCSYLLADRMKRELSILQSNGSSIAHLIAPVTSSSSSHHRADDATTGTRTYVACTHVPGATRPAPDDPGTRRDDDRRPANATCLADDVKNRAGWVTKNYDSRHHKPKSNLESFAANNTPFQSISQRRTDCIELG